MQANVGSIDRVTRIILCPAYVPFGMRNCSVEK
jgi:hypothetical protein